MGSIMPIFMSLCVPVFADMDEDTMEIDPEDIEKKITPRTRAILAIHLTGNACNMEKIMDIAGKHNIYVVEDCAQSFETTFRGEPVGRFGDLGCFSFNQHKHITCGDGGMTVTNNDEFAERARLFSDKAWPREKGRTSLFVAPNYRVTELQAAVMLAQIKKVKSICEKRNNLGNLLTKLVRDIRGIKVQESYPGSRHTYWFYTLRVPAETRDRFVDAIKAEGVPAIGGYVPRPVYLYEVFQSKSTFGNSHFPFGFAPFRPSPEPISYEEGICPVAEKTIKEMIKISLNEFWSEEDVKKTAQAVRKASRLL
jgi:perosamine synthetase